MSYDGWLEAPFQERCAKELPDDVAELLDQEVWIEEEDEWCVVDSYEAWEDADEDGRYGGIDLIVKAPNGSTRNMTVEEIWMHPIRDSNKQIINPKGNQS